MEKDTPTDPPDVAGGQESTEMLSGLADLPGLSHLQKLWSAEKKPDDLNIPDKGEARSAFDEVENRWQAAKGVQSPTMLQRLKENVVNFGNSFQRHFVHIDPNKSSEYALLSDILRVYENSPEWSKAVAADRVAEITEKMGPERLGLFTRAVVLPDIIKDVKANLYEGKDLPFGYKDLAQVERDLERFTKLIDNNPDIKEALKRRESFVRSLSKRLVDNDLLPSEALEDTSYYHRQVMAYVNLKDASYIGAGAGDVRLHRKGFQIKRVGGGDFNTAYHEAEFEWIAQAYQQLNRKEVLDRIDELSNIKPELKQQAKNNNLLAAHGSVELWKQSGISGDMPSSPIDRGQQVVKKIGSLRDQIRESLESPDKNESDQKMLRKALHESLDTIDILSPFRNKITLSLIHI